MFSMFTWLMFIPFLTLSFTWSHGQEKSLLYYDLFNFRVLFYGRTPTLIFFFHILYTPTPILTIEVLVMWADLEKSMRRPRCMAKREIPAVRWRSLFGPNQGLPRLNRSFHQISQYGRLDHVIGNPHRIRQGSAANSYQESHLDLILTGRRVRVGTTPTLWDILQIPIEPPPKSSLCHLPLHLLGFCLYPINPGRFSNQYRTSADRCTPKLPRWALE